MIKFTVEETDIETGFIRKCLNQNVRLDGRSVTDYNEVNITLSRQEKSSYAKVLLGQTRVLTVVKGIVCQPYTDRPSDGILQINVDVSLYSNKSTSSASHLDISRYLERSIRDSEAIDLESLCIKAGEQVWCIICDVKLLDYQGCAIDACMLSAIAALRSYRRSDVSIEGGKSFFHHSDDREPLPLALHHTPLAVTLGLFKLTAADGKTEVSHSHMYFNAEVFFSLHRLYMYISCIYVYVLYRVIS